MNRTEIKFYIGTAGWKYEDWVGSFYPKKESANFDWLSFYSKHFNCIEVNSTFYAYLNENIAAGWIRKTEAVDDFVFTIKLHQDFTHKKTFTKQNVEDANKLLKILSDAGRLGGILIQFPQSFRFDNANAQYISRLKDIFAQYEIFLEVRHGSFHSVDALEFLRMENLNIITIDQPEIGNAIKFNPIITSDKLYFRLHGRNKEEWFKGFDKMGQQQQTEHDRNARYNYLYMPGELTEITLGIKSVLGTARKVYVTTNNHPNGNAVANAFQLINLLEGRKPEIPPTSMKVFPLLKEISNSPPATDLFNQ